MDIDPTTPGPEAIVEPYETFLGLGSTGWLAVAFVLFLLVLWRVGAFAAIGRALDNQGEKVRAALAEAESLKAEAERLRADAAREAEQAAEQARAILAQAEAEAGRIVTQAEADAEAAIARRTRLAEDRIGAAERAAEADLRARAADLSVQAAEALLAREAGEGRLRHLTDEAISGLASR
jgi:F-type H+-transporting ATPase subunit b